MDIICENSRYHPSWLRCIKKLHADGVKKGYLLERSGFFIEEMMRKKELYVLTNSKNKLYGCFSISPTGSANAGLAHTALWRSSIYAEYVARAINTIGLNLFSSCYCEIYDRNKYSFHLMKEHAGFIEVNESVVAMDGECTQIDSSPFIVLKIQRDKDQKERTNQPRIIKSKRVLNEYTNSGNRHGNQIYKGI